MQKMTRVFMITWILTVMAVSRVGAQTGDFVRYDHVYQPGIKSVQLMIPGYQLIPPIIELKQEYASPSIRAFDRVASKLDSLMDDPANRGDLIPEQFYTEKDQYEIGRALRLSFDELTTEARFLVYKLEHCNADWQKSDLEEFEFLSRINEQRIRNFEFSFNTQIPYVHYWLNLPNGDQSFTKSGNYLLHVYDENTGEKILTKRFVVYENLLKVTGNLITPFDVAKIYTHHEMSFNVESPNLEIKNPLTSISVWILQNGRWDNAIQNVKPSNYVGTKFNFNDLGAYAFPAGNEFRHFDIRSLRYPTRQVIEIEKDLDGAIVTLKPDEPRGQDKFWSDWDINGTFLIQSFDQRESPVTGEYAHVFFSMKSPQPIHNHIVYIVGGFSNWELDDAYVMDYSDKHSAYFGEATLKQGVYDYIYAAAPLDGGDPNFQMLEGNWHETENYYNVLVYYRPFGVRYDRLIGITTITQK